MKKTTAALIIGLVLFGAYRIFVKKNPQKPTNTPNTPNAPSNAVNSTVNSTVNSAVNNTVNNPELPKRNLNQSQIDDLLDEFRRLQYNNNEQTIRELLENATFYDFMEIEKQAVEKQIIHPGRLPEGLPYELLSVVADRSPYLLHFLADKYPDIAVKATRLEKEIFRHRRFI